jgi:hypothetical protein
VYCFDFDKNHGFEFYTRSEYKLDKLHPVSVHTALAAHCDASQVRPNLVFANPIPGSGVPDTHILQFNQTSAEIKRLGFRAMEAGNTARALQNSFDDDMSKFTWLVATMCNVQGERARLPGIVSQLVDEGVGHRFSNDVRNKVILIYIDFIELACLICAHSF